MNVKQPVYDKSNRTSGVGSGLPVRSDLALRHHAEIAFDVSADILGMTRNVLLP